ncbi:transposase [Methylococcus sp. ANG]|uniref:transposase n=1 Tax=unclassified Methylococcus TaxID=2618889 RepID=UPI001C530EED|nr:transposase [Methylococcus sp. Mc7]
MKPLSYPSDLNEHKLGGRIERYFQPNVRRSSGSRQSRKRIIDVILYLVKTGVQWRQLPHNFPLGKRCATMSAAGTKVYGSARWTT